MVRRRKLKPARAEKIPENPGLNQGSGTANQSADSCLGEGLFRWVGALDSSLAV
jgi:hypothetical protein